MEIPGSNDNPFQYHKEIAATIGFFDGVHVGHRFLLKQLKEQADARQLPSVAITFFQHPRNILQPKSHPKLLNTFEERIERLSTSGIDHCLPIDFTYSLSQLSAQAFIQKKLKEEWQVKLLLIGYNHRFGKNRTEGFDDYVKYGKACGMEILQALELPGISVSSTHIRNCLSKKNLREANRMLSYFYRLEGKVVEGNRLGRVIGFPTANLDVIDKNKIIPGEGIYAVWVYWKKKKYRGMAYIGKRPTVTIHGEKRIEVHLFDFSGDLYGETLQLEFVEFIRESVQFDNLLELKKQLFVDRDTAINALDVSVK